MCVINGEESNSREIGFRQTENLNIKNKIYKTQMKIKEKNNSTSSEKIIARITDIINKKDYNSKVYERLVDEIIVFGSELHIYFKDLKKPVALRYTTKGRGTGYRVLCSIAKD